ncbi:VTT domain-containing protein [uncultured Negativibacillus sp.]|mgnify:CR=1 FL=1|uniref:TVP38/TMEM64 family protein n=1 Tax=uncultured Negativibacillus sp. TaxID=1980696 RepID=UPI0025D57255|nr:VTT domain-containing protein [uncultured Negativibacillus sp.]
MKKELPNKKREWVRLILSALVLFAMVPITILAIPKVMALTQPHTRELLQRQLESLGIGGWVAFLGIQVIQVVVAMIPGEPIEILAGILYGPLWGTLTCMLGIFIGSIIVYLLVRKLGMPIVSIFIDPEKFQNLRILQDERRFERIAFLLFFIPGTPKDLLTWAAGLIHIRPLRFFILSTIARLPSILTSTLAGTTLLSGDFSTTVLIFVVTGCISMVGLWAHKKLS